jgi:hypothetical protein
VEFLIGAVGALSATSLLGVAAFLGRNWFLARLNLSLQKEHSKFLEEIQWERKTREQAEKVAEYLAFARQLRKDSKEEDYIKANQLSWELAMWLPEEIYNETVKAIASPSNEVNELSVVIGVRKLLLKEKAGTLSPDNIAHHAPGIGE